MMSVPDLRIWLKLSLALFVLVSSCTTFVSGVKAAQKEQVRLKVKVAVINQTGAGIEGATVTIVRQGMTSNKGEELKDVTGKTGKDGIWPGETRDYPQKDTPYILHVSAPGYKDLTNDKDLSFQNLKAAFDKGISYSIMLSMTREGEGGAGNVTNSGNGVPTVGSNVSSGGGSGVDGRPPGSNANTDQGPGEKGRGVSQSTDGSFMDTLGSGIGTGLRWLAGLSLALIIAALLTGWLLGYRVSFYRLGVPTWRQEIGAVMTRLSNLEGKVKDAITGQETTNKSLAEMALTLTTINEQLAESPSAQERMRQQQAARMNNASSRASDLDAQNQNRHRMGAHLLPQDEARAAYRNLVLGNASSQDFIYLSAEGGSALGKLEDKYVYLVEDSTQGAFVLFTLDRQRGWVFPNPSLRFRQNALRPVFPQLTEEMFEYNKEALPPNEASNAGAGRWRVEP